MKTNSLWDKRPGGKKVERLGAIGVSECKCAMRSLRGFASVQACACG